MKLCSSLLLTSVALAQQYNDYGSDRWGGSFSYDYGLNEKTDGGLAYNINQEEATGDTLHHNGLYCWTCDERLDLGTGLESNLAGGFNAYSHCLMNGHLQKCRGEQRTCLFEERRRHGVVYSVITGCKQTDACLALWRRNQRFTLPFMNFGDQSIMNLQSPGRPHYVDDECTTYQNTDDSTFAIADTRTNVGLSYSKFAYDRTDGQQENSQMSQWESACRWCCAATFDSVCNLDVTSWYASPIATKCGSLDNSQAPSGGFLPTIAGVTDLSDGLGGTDASRVATLVAGNVFGSAACTLSNAQWTGGTLTGKFVFFQPFMLSEAKGKNQDNASADTWIHNFVSTALRDLSASSKQPVTGENRNSMGMDKYKFRGNSYDQSAALSWNEHYFEHQSDMLSQENRDMFDRRADQDGRLAGR